MKKIFSIVALAALSLSAFAQESKPSIEIHGFIRNFYAYDSHKMIGLTEDFFTYVPYDVETITNTSGDVVVEDVNEYPNFRFAALTSRLWIEVKGYEFEGWKMGARVEGDFFNGLGTDKVTGTANFRLRQAFVTASKYGLTFKAGQSWHPMAADMPDVFSLNTGAPFGPFARTPLFQVDYNLGDGFSLTGAALWQMQYTSNGPEGKSASYIKYGCTPELYAGVNYKTDGIILRAGLNMLSIKPVLKDAQGFRTDRITTFIPFFYAQYAKDLFSVKFKTVYAEGGEHLNLNGGYGVSKVLSDGNREYTPTRNSSSWLSLKYGKKVQGILFAGYAKNFGTKEALDGSAGVPTGFYFSGNSFDNFNQMYRLTPTVIYNLGKLALGLEYELTSVQYGNKALGMNLETGLYDQGLHWVTNNRVQGLVKFTF
ncbi:MAG: hypothetical protein K6F21_04570 [Bacteroidales bacterium]|nr:hypothetical protein [Bacteroidales bacterium]